jgi:two-component system cell cycle sensor histidine kinase PleC
MTKFGAQQMGDFGIDPLDRTLPARQVGTSDGEETARWAKARVLAEGLPRALGKFDFLQSSASRYTLLLTALFLVILSTFLVIKVRTDFDLALDHIEETTQSISTLTGSHLDTLLESTSSLLGLIDEASVALSTPGLLALSDGVSASGNNLHRVLIVDAHGTLIDPYASPLSLAEAAALSAALSAAMAGVQNPIKAKDRVVFPPSSGVPVSGKSYFSLSHELKNTGTGQKSASRLFAVALISTAVIDDYLIRSRLTSLLGRAGTVSLLSSAGKIHAVHPQKRSADQIMAIEEAISQLRLTAPASGETSATSLDYLELSGGDFLLARRTAAHGADLIVLAPLGEVMFALRRSWPPLAGIALVALLFSMAVASFLTRQARKGQKADHLLEQSELLFELAATSAKCGLWDWNIDKQEMFWSSSIMQLLGFDSRGSSLTFTEALNLVHPSDRKYLRRVESNMRKGQTHFETKFRLKHANGHYLWMRARGEVKETQGGKSQKSSRRFFGILIDMTDELMATAREEQAKINLQNAVESISDAFVLWDRNKKSVLTNSRFETWRPFDANAAWEALEEDREIEQADGRWIQLKSNRVSGGGVVTLARDITDLKVKNAALEESRGALNETIKDLRTSRSHLRVLAEKFEDEKRRAEEANRSKTEFLANMSHELRTPLNAIIGFSEIMETGMFGPLGDDRYNEYAGDIRKSGRGLLELINDILDMSRIESGKYQVECETLKTGEMVDDCLRIIETRAEDKGIEIRNTIDLVPDIYADSGAVKHILINILSNAIKFNNESGSIEISCVADLETVTITVEDSGIGIAPADLAKLGTAFVQFENHTEKKYSGSGLGLAISMSLVEMMSGDILIESTEGVGTHVSISLPRHEGLAVEAGE